MMTGCNVLIMLSIDVIQCIEFEVEVSCIEVT